MSERRWDTITVQGDYAQYFVRRGMGDHTSPTWRFRVQVIDLSKVRDPSTGKHFCNGQEEANLLAELNKLHPEEELIKASLDMICKRHHAFLHNYFPDRVPFTVVRDFVVCFTAQQTVLRETYERVTGSELSEEMERLIVLVDNREKKRTAKKRQRDGKKVNGGQSVDDGY